MLCATFQSDWVIAKWVMGKRDFARFEFKNRLGRIFHIVHGASLTFDHHFCFYSFSCSVCAKDMSSNDPEDREARLPQNLPTNQSQLEHTGPSKYRYSYVDLDAEPNMSTSPSRSMRVNDIVSLYLTDGDLVRRDEICLLSIYGDSMKMIYFSNNSLLIWQ